MSANSVPPPSIGSSIPASAPSSQTAQPDPIQFTKSLKERLKIILQATPQLKIENGERDKLNHALKIMINRLDPESVGSNMKLLKLRVFTYLKFDTAKDVIESLKASLAKEGETNRDLLQTVELALEDCNLVKELVQLDPLVLGLPFWKDIYRKFKMQHPAGSITDGDSIDQEQLEAQKFHNWAAAECARTFGSSKPDEEAEERETRSLRSSAESTMAATANSSEFDASTGLNMLGDIAHSLNSGRYISEGWPFELSGTSQNYPTETPSNNVPELV